MPATLVDVIYLALALGLLAGGWQQGFVKAAGSLVAFVVSIAVSVWGISFIESNFGSNLLANPVSVIVAFLLLTLVLSKILGLFVWILDALRKLLSFIPLVGFLNSLGGLFVGGLQVVLATAFFGWLLTMLPEAQQALFPITAKSVQFAHGLYATVSGFLS